MKFVLMPGIINNRSNFVVLQNIFVENSIAYSYV